MEDTDIGFDEFFDAFEGGDGNQTDAVAEEESTDTAAKPETERKDDATHEGESKPESEETTAEENTQEAKEDGTEDKEDADAGNKEQTFTIKVNSEERTIGLAEMTELAQKGADYDRTKQQLKESRQTVQSLQGDLDKQRGLLDVLDMVAKGSQSTPEQLVESLYVSFRKNAGVSEDAAKLELKNARMEKELSAMKGQAEKADTRQKTDEASSRLQRDMEEFEKEYPDVKLDDALVEKLAEDIKSGVSLTAAYRKMERAQQAEKVAELERQLAAEKQNKKNRNKSPGSQTDSGGQRQKDAYADFFAAFEK